MPKRTATIALTAALLIVTACGPATDTSELGERITELEHELQSIAPASTVTSIASATTSSTLHDLSPDVVRQRFEQHVAATIDNAVNVVARDVPAVEMHNSEFCAEATQTLDAWVAAIGWTEGAYSLQTIQTLTCNDHARTYEISETWSYDIERADSIISPFSGVATVPVTIFRVLVDRNGLEVEAPLSVQKELTLSWAYQDSEWILRSVDGDLDEQLLASMLALFAFGIPPSESVIGLPTTASTTFESTTTTYDDRSDGALDLGDSEIACTENSIEISVVVKNNTNQEVALSYAGFFPGGGFGHAAHDFDTWWPLPVLSPGEAVEHEGVLEISTSKPSEDMEIFVSWSSSDAWGDETIIVHCGP